MRQQCPVGAPSPRQFVAPLSKWVGVFAERLNDSPLVRVLYTRAPVRVLLVEAGARPLPFTRDLLVGFDEVVVTTEADAIAVVSASREAGTDLVIVARDAWQDVDTKLCQGLHAARLEVPLLAVSGACEMRQRAGALRAGADDFLGVPFEVEEFVARAFALVRRASSGSRHARAGPFSVDYARRQILVGGQSLALTLREYDLLAKLIERAGEVVTRRELSGETASGQEGESNVVDVHMSRIRDKLGTHAVHVETVRGLGYRLKQS